MADQLRLLLQWPRQHCGLERRAETAASLLGASEGVGERVGAPIQTYAKQVFDERAAPVRERLTEPEVAAAWEAGRAMSEDDAVSLALATAAELAPL